MAGLFERDYTVLTSAEQAEKDGIDSEGGRVSGAKFGRRNFFHKYPKAVRHYMSLFPNNYMDHVDLQNVSELESQCDEFETLLSNKGITEIDIKRFIQNNRYYHIPASIFRRFNFGHHEAALFKEFPLGTQYRADYLLVGRGSGGWQFVFVEFENPYPTGTNVVVTAEGNWGGIVRSGLSQIEDWKSFIEANYSTIHSEFLRYTHQNLPSEFTQYDSTRMHYVVVAGRREDFSNAETRQRQRRYELENNIMILHYDNLLDDSRSLIGARTY